MRTLQATENGNITINSQTNENFINNIDRGWLSANIDSNNSNENQTNNTLINTNYNTIYSSSETTQTFLNYTNSIENSETKVNVEFVVCNRQYRINSQNNLNFGKHLTENNLEELKGDVANHGPRLEESNEFSDDTPVDDDRVFDHSDTDEMSENGVQSVPRGIVNPNYPGFQHLAHTLQDYSSNIENFYHSENDMTDDDGDIEITELSYEIEANQNTIDSNNINVNNNHINKEKPQLSKHETKKTNLTDRNDTYSEIPDLIKTVSKNNNNNEVDLFEYDIHCSDTDIENNFKTKDIIGDFNKEIEDEIKQLLNYNINIQDDLEELRKDIKDTFAKPIENTINNISDVVNHVIKKLVENDFNEDCNKKIVTDDDALCKQHSNEETANINNENENNARMEMNLSRPTFLNIDSTNTKIDDAFLSDGKDEINLSEYDTDKLSQNVENTIKQLSTELRKIIPKLDEMKERDRLWAESKKHTVNIVIDRNSNEISNLTSDYSHANSIKTQTNSDVTGNNRHLDIAQAAARHGTEGVAESRNKNIQSPSNQYIARCNSSVRKTNKAKDLDLESFDVYNIETALPKLDIDAIESHLKAAKEAERRKRNDREEIRKRLAMGAEAEEYYSLGYTDRPGRKPSLHSRLQSGMNLQICFMNETASDNESQYSDLDRNVNYSTKSLSRSSLVSRSSYNHNHPYQTRPLSVNITKHDKVSSVQCGTKLRPSSLTVKTTKSRSSHSLSHIEIKESDFFALQSTLQTEARIALAQAKEMARIQMERERRSRPVSPVTEMLRRSMLKANAPLASDRRRVSRQLLTDMNIAQLQVIVNELHSQIESLNDTLVKLLMARDELHMGQDSMLVDIEDLTRYLGVKEQTKKTKGIAKTGMKRLTSLVNK